MAKKNTLHKEYKNIPVLNADSGILVDAVNKIEALKQHLKGEHNEN